MEPTAPQTNNKTWDSMPELPSWNIPSWGATATGGKNVQSDTNLSMNNLPILSRNGSLTSQSMNQLPDTKDVHSGDTSRSSNDQIQHSIAQNSNISPTNNANSDASAAATIQEQLTSLVMLQNQQLQQQQEQLKNQRLKIEELREELHLEKESRRRQSLLLQSMAQGGQGSKQGVSVGGEQLGQTGQAGQPGNLRQPYQAYGATPQQQWIAAQQQQAQVQQQAQYQNQNPYGAMNGVGMRGTQQAINPYANLSGVIDPYKQSMNGVGSVGGVHPGQTPGFIGMGGGGAPNIMSSDPSARVTSPYGHEQLPHRLEFNRATGEWVEIGHVHGQGGVQNVVQNGMQNGMQGLGVQGLGVQGLGVKGLGVQGLGVQDQIGGGGGGMDPRATGFVPSSPDGRTNGKGVVRKVISSNGTVVQSSGTSQSRRSNGRANQASVIDSEKIIGGEEERTTLMIRNIPNRYTRQMILNELNEKKAVSGTYDFLYLPIDFQNSCNLGYAFVNMVSPLAVVQLYNSMHGYPWKLSRSSKICQLVWGRLQGKEALLAHFRGTVHLNNTPSEFRPIAITKDASGANVVEEVM